jgi:hypothetical protein
MKNPDFAQNPAFARLVEALAERLVQDHLTGKTAPEREKPKGRPKHVPLKVQRKAA